MMRCSTVDICVCTFRRPHLRNTLLSIAALDAEGIVARVIVADNDHTPSAQAIVEAAAAELPFGVKYLHSPASNISIARNACLEAVDAEYVAFIDDDELSSPRWLRELLTVAQATAADAVLGPVAAVYNAASPRWLIRGDFHSTVPVFVNGSIHTGYTCNVLIRWRPPIAALRFDTALGRSGGEDTDFFYRLHDLGGTIVHAPLALVFEPVPPEREKMSWLLRRRLRSGQTHGARLARPGVIGRTIVALPSAAKVCFCLYMALATALSPVAWRRNLLRATLHVGVLAGIMGARQAVHYGRGDNP
jgi:succinoglycan biosynthesis protein ExoM